MSQIFSIILIFLFAFFPIFLWGYAMNMLSDHEWNRARFFYGMIWWGISVGVIYFLHDFLLSSFFSRIFAIVTILFLLLVFVLVASRYGSGYVRTFLRKIALLHAGLFLIFFVIIETLLYFFEADISRFLPVISTFSAILFAAALEESLKHLSSVWLTAKEFRFSRRDLLVFGFFITLGFVFIENILYLMKAYHLGTLAILSTGFTRSVFSLLAHLFAASICAMVWWKALSYKVFSMRYSLTFIGWFILASLAHFLFNTLANYNLQIGIMIYVIVAYVAFTQWLILDE